MGNRDVIVLAILAGIVTFIITSFLYMVLVG